MRKFLTRLIFGPKQTHCHGCGMPLAIVPLVVEDERKKYCGRRCVDHHRLIRAAGTVCSRWYVAVAGIIALLMMTFATAPKARAQHEEMYGHDMGHAQHHDSAYSKWQKPDGTGSCCNLKVMSVDGKTRVSGDCYPTEGRLVPDPETYELHWWALKDNGNWISIPEATILKRTKNPDESGRSAHLCESGGPVLCFREPVGVD